MFKKLFFGLIVLVLLAAVLAAIFLPSYVEKDHNVVLSHSPYKVSKQAKNLHQSLIVGDWHADSLLWNRDLTRRANFGQVDIPRLQAGNVALQMFTVVTKSPAGQNYAKNATDARDNITLLAVAQRWPIASWDSLTARALYQAEKLHVFEKANPQSLKIIRDQKQLAAFIKARQQNPNLVGGLLGTEGSHALDGELKNIRKLYEAGFRMMSLQHFFDNKLGGSLHGTTQSGLTQFGIDAVRTMQALNIIVDVSHSSEQVVKDVLKISTKPLVVSHTGFKGHCNTLRNISDQTMRQIAATGGLIGVGYWKAAICEVTPKSIADSIIYGVKLVGDEHVALGSDFDGSVATPFDTSELAAITQALLDKGLAEESIRKVMGGNMLRFLQQQLPLQ